MVVREIVVAAGVRLPTKSRTPDTVVARDLAMDIKRRGDESIFRRVAPGKYTLAEYAAEFVAQPAVTAAPAVETMVVVPPPPADVPPETTLR
jgi:hypothetical protein